MRWGDDDRKGGEEEFNRKHVINERGIEEEDSGMGILMD